MGGEIEEVTLIAGISVVAAKKMGALKRAVGLAETRRNP
jgi:hypothetical protein